MKEPTKAILVINMPEQCDDCDFCQGGDWLSYLCGLTGEEFEFVNGERKHFCPLKPFPKYYPSTSNPQRIEYLKQLGMTEKEQYYYELGHDDCIDEILGEKQ